ncbi:hypothetical protein KQI84_09130 [bacterium]|nr:hypothetical protein [bacterium]
MAVDFFERFYDEKRLRRRPLFRPYQVRRDPLLAEADTCPLLDVFRSRRDYRRTGMRSIWGWMTHADYKTVIWRALLLIVFLMSPPLWLLIWIVSSLTRRIMRKMRTPEDESAPPRYASHVFVEKGVVKKTALELWMCGISGEDFAKAIYFERQRDAHLVSLLFGVLFAVGSIITFVLTSMKGWPGWLLSLHTFVFLAATAFLSYRLFWALLKLNTHQSISYLEKQVMFWQAKFKFPFWRRFRREALHAAVVVAWIVAGFVIITLFVFQFAFVMGLASGMAGASGAILSHLVNHAAAYGFSLMFVELALLIWLAEFLAGRRTEWRKARVLADCGDVFDLILNLFADSKTEDVVQWYLNKKKYVNAVDEYVAERQHLDAP